MRFETNDPALLAAADASFGRFAVPVDGREPLVVSLFTEPGRSGSPGADDEPGSPIGYLGVSNPRGQGTC